MKDEQKIHELIEHNERLVQLAIVASENGEEQVINDIVAALNEIFLEIYSYRKSRPQKYSLLMRSSVTSQSPLAQIFGSKSDYYNQYTFLGSYRAGLYKIWTACYDSERWASTRFLVYKVQIILKVLVKEQHNDHVVNEFLLLLAQVSYYGLDTGNFKDSRVTHLIAPAYQWYFNLVFSQDDESRFDLKYLTIFDEFIWGSFRRMINFDSFNLFKAFVSTSLQGSYSGLSTRRPIYYLFKSVTVSSDILRDISLVDREMSDIREMTDYISVIGLIRNTITKYTQHLIDGVSEQEAIDQLNADATKIFKSNNLKINYYLFGAFLVFKKKFDWINYLWEYHQPTDADATWGFNDLLPGDLSAVFDFLINQHSYQARVEFSWEDHHGIEPYYLKYGVLLLARLFFIPKFYVFHDQILEPSVLLSNININEYDHVVSLSERLKQYVSAIEEFSGFKDKKISPNNQDAIPLRQAILSLLDRIKASASSEKTRKMELVEFEDADLRSLLESVNFTYLSENQVNNIFSSFESSPQVGVLASNQIREIEVSVFRTKEDFISQWQSGGSVVSFEGGKNLALRFTAEIVSQISGHPSTIRKEIKDSNLANELVEIFKSVLNWERPVVIGLGVNFLPYLWNDKNFQVVGGDKSEKIGSYTIEAKAIEIFNVKNWVSNDSVIIIDQSAFGVLSLVEPTNSPGTQVKSYIKGLYEENLNDFAVVSHFKFWAYYALEFIEAPRIIRVKIAAH